MRSSQRVAATIFTLAVVSQILLAGPAGAGEGDSNTNVFVDAQSGGRGPAVALEGRSDRRSVSAGASQKRGSWRPPAWLLACRYDTLTLLEFEALQGYKPKAGFETTDADGEIPDPAAEAPAEAHAETPAAGEPADVDGAADPDELWTVVFCIPGDGSIAYNPSVLLTGVLASWPQTARPPQIVLDLVISRAYDAVELPVQTTETAPSGDVDAPLIAQLPTWVWIDDQIWQPHAATPESVFGVTATATATPYAVTIETSDGQSVECGANVGEVYDFDRPAEGQTSPCTVTLEHSSSVGVVTVGSTVRWTVTYECSQFCGPGVLPDVVVSSSRPVVVAELQALGTTFGREK